MILSLALVNLDQCFRGDAARMRQHFAGTLDLVILGQDAGITSNGA